MKLKVISEKIVEKDFCEISLKLNTIEEQVEEIKHRFEFEVDKTLMNKMIKKIKENVYNK